MWFYPVNAGGGSLLLGRLHYRSYVRDNEKMADLTRFSPK